MRINTKWIMTSSAVVLGLGGILLTFMPQEILRLSGVDPVKPLDLLVQMIGALYFGFAMLNWMLKSSLIGGIYNRPITIANFSHFLIAAMALIKTMIHNPVLSSSIRILGIIYAVFALSFAILLFQSPAQKSINTEQLKL